MTTKMKMSMKLNRKNIAKDFILNIISNALPVIVLQLVVQPFLASQLGAEENGKFVTTMSLLHFVVILLGSTLHTTRLIAERQYEEANQVGDFNIGLICLCLPCLLFTSIGCSIIGFSLTDILFISVLSVIWMVKDYVIVEYRLKINYTRILINNVVWSLGYIIGIFLYKVLPYWYVIILSGTILSFIYTVFSTNILEEPLRRTALLTQTSKSFGILFFTNSMKVFVQNFDRFVIFAMMTGAAVSTYYSASIMGKLISMLSVPIGNVVLSYLVNLKSISRKNYNKITLAVVGIGLLSYVVSVAVSPFLLRLLYPNWADESMSLIYLTCGISFFELIRQFISPFILRFCNLHFQLHIYGLYSVLYVIGGIFSLSNYGLYGFAVSNLLVSGIIALLVWIIGRIKIV